ncbi:MAG: aminoacetone oxidase family FAD-binding enzyme [Saprospirales bacterium]|nr:aminoacetone oxidase family FAD-binding enzyme [Saprospirales bacterium]
MASTGKFSEEKKYDLIVVGGGAAGFFTAIRVGELRPGSRILILEKGGKVLQKVRISGGGRCNVTHACFEPKELVKNYPRGSRELLGPFHRFQPGDTIAWFENHGVELKIEPDGRMFPVTNDSATIVECLTQAARWAGVQVRTSCNVEQLQKEPDGTFTVTLTGGESFRSKTVMMAPGSSPRMWQLLREMGHSIVEPVPSLFTFNCRDARIAELPGVSVEKAALRIPGTGLSESGPLLITHWGLSGPAVLKLSAWGARKLHALNYRFDLLVNWTGVYNTEEVKEELASLRNGKGSRKVLQSPRFGLPSRLWRKLCPAAGIDEKKNWADLSKAQLNVLASQLSECRLPVTGKSTFKEEFVTAGGVALHEVDFRRFESKRIPGLFLAGEVLDIDAITGGFNFQAAWTGGWVAGEGVVKYLE